MTKDRPLPGAGSNEKDAPLGDFASRDAAPVARAMLECQAADVDRARAPDLRLLCERCGSVRRVVATLPSTADLPQTSVLECVGCQIIDLLV